MYFEDDDMILEEESVTEIDRKEKVRKRRKHNVSKALRKRNIVKNAYGWEEGYYSSLHQYSKNKIHCSCPMCSAKRKDRGPKFSELRQLLNCEEQLQTV